MKKIALCFMVYDKIQCEDIWEKWITPNKDKIKIVIHSKRPLEIGLKDYVQIPTIETKWGDFSLVEATIALYKEAIKDETVEYCILLSGSCIPIKSFNHVYETLISSGEKSISNVMGSGRLGFGNTIFPLARESISKHEQWIILNRKHCQYVIDELWRIRFTFKRKNSHPPDEIWFNTFMKVSGLDKEIIYIKTTFTNWNKRGRPHPHTYESITDEELDDILQNECLFARKFVKNSFTESQVAGIVNSILSN